MRQEEVEETHLLPTRPVAGGRALHLEMEGTGGGSVVPLAEVYPGQGQEQAGICPGLPARAGDTAAVIKERTKRHLTCKYFSFAEITFS